MDENKQKATENAGETEKGVSPVRTSMRSDYKVKRSVPLDIAAAVLSLLLAVALWLVLGA